MTDKLPSQMPHVFPPIAEARLDDEFIVFCAISERWMDYVVLEVIAEDVPSGAVSFTKRGAVTPTDFADGVDDAQVFLRGSLKWDGCADLTIGEGGDYQLHFCGRRSALLVQRVIEKLYSLAADHMEHFDPELAK